ncbi:MAG: EamA family transporter [Deltaproteobacteria bacterium]|nr:EamA family transporter [Deltaproteobacteria bacterium]
MCSKIYSYGNLTLAMIIVGSSVVFGKVITHSFPVFLASGLRFAIASVIMLPILLKSEEKLFKVSKKDIVYLVSMAFCGQFVFTVLVLFGLRYTSAIEAGIITSTSPAMMVAVNYLLFRERPGVIPIFAVLLVVIGIISINGFLNLDRVTIASSHIFGNLLMIGAVLGEAFFLLMRKRISADISNLALTGYLCFLGFIIFLPLSIYQGISFDFYSVSSVAWMSILYFGAVFTVLAYILWFQGVSKVSGNTAGVFTAVMPVSAVVLSCLFLKERFILDHAFGGVLILLAIFLITMNPKKNE